MMKILLQLGFITKQRINLLFAKTLFLVKFYQKLDLKRVLLKVIASVYDIYKDYMC